MDDSLRGDSMPSPQLTSTTDIASCWSSLLHVRSMDSYVSPNLTRLYTRSGI